jgi:hypothetical protein
MLLAAVAAMLLAGSVAAAGLSGRESSAVHTDQATEALYSEIQDLSYNLADANATAATALLIGPVTPSAFTTRFGIDVTQVEDLLSAASQRVAGDASASYQLQLLAEQVPEFTQWIGQALADNRFGYPVAGAYLRQASTMLTQRMLPEVQAVITEQNSATQGGISSAASTDWAAIGLCVLALGVLVAVGAQVSRRTKRRANPGVALAKLAVLALLVWTVAAAGLSTAAADSAQTDFNAVAQAQTGGSQLALAESYVALQQIDRGEDAGVDQKDALQALASLSSVGASSDSPSALAAVDAFSSCSRGAIGQASAGEYQQAITATVGGAQDVGQGGCEPGAVLVRADLVALTKQRQQEYDADMARLESAYTGSGALPLPLAAGLLGALAAAWGINRRLAEYR